MRITLLIAFLVFVPTWLFAQTEFSEIDALKNDEVLSVEIGPRPMGSPAEHRAMEYAVSRFREYGCDTAYILTMPYSSESITTSGIAVGIKRGATGRIIVLGGHIDSAGPEIPGADDDGSGAASVIELAHTLAKRKTESTIVFCCFGGEERGLEGSNYFVDHFPLIDSVVLMVQIDMANGIGKIDMDPETNGAMAPPWLVQAAIDEFYSMGYRGLGYPTRYFSMNYARGSGAGSDQEPFLRKGIPAIDFSTDVSTPIHTPRDNFENFDPRGLKRSGDLAVRLFERFDHGVPSKTTSEYWLLVLGRKAITLPIPVLWGFIFVCILVGLTVMFSFRKYRLPIGDPRRYAMPALKLLALLFLVILCAWLSSDLIGVVKGYRHPWFTDMVLYKVLALFAGLVGVGLLARLSRKMQISFCPYTLFRTSVIALVLETLLCTWWGVKIGIYPAMGLLLLSVAMLVRSPGLKVLFSALAPVTIYRLIFSEWQSLIFHSAVEGLPISGFMSISGVNIVLAFLLTLIFFPFAPGIVAAVRSSSELSGVGSWMRSRRWMFTATGGFAIVAIVAIYRPVYDRFWFRDVRVVEQFDMTAHKQTVQINSPEFLTGVKLAHGGIDTLIASRTTELEIAPRSYFDTTWANVARSDSTTKSGDTTTHNIRLVIRSKFRPYVVDVHYSAGIKDIAGFETPLKCTYTDNSRTLEWYSFPDTTILVPVKFQTVSKDSVTESISILFDSLAYPMTLQRPLTYFLPRTTYSNSHTYSGR
jgi:hypothetical protein